MRHNYYNKFKHLVSDFPETIIGYNKEYDVFFDAVEGKFVIRWNQVKKRFTSVPIHPDVQQRFTIRVGVKGKTYNVRIHRLVAEYWYGPKPIELVCCHNDGNRQNNHYRNLRYDTQQSNVRDSINHKTHKCTNPKYILRGEKSGKAKYTEEIVRNIREQYANGARQVDIARNLGISRNTIFDIVHYRNWGHIE